MHKDVLAGSRGAQRRPPTHPDVAFGKKTEVARFPQALWLHHPVFVTPGASNDATSRSYQK